jgi:hypothetical protein
MRVNTDNAIIREGIHGQYSEWDFAFDAALLKPGSNTITLDQTATPNPNASKGVMYDSIRLELDDSHPFDKSKAPPKPEVSEAPKDEGGITATHPQLLSANRTGVFGVFWDRVRENEQSVDFATVLMIPFCRDSAADIRFHFHLGRVSVNSPSPLKIFDVQGTSVQSDDKTSAVDRETLPCRKNDAEIDQCLECAFSRNHVFVKIASDSKHTLADAGR